MESHPARTFGEEARKLERVRCSSLVDRPVYPRLRRIMLTTTPKRNPVSKSNKSDAKMTPDRVAEAQRMAREWRPK
jgi:hypothetical protein